MIDKKDDLQDLCRCALETDRVALDTEFVWERTFFPRLGIVQIGLSESDVHLVDVLALPTLPGLGDVLESPETTLILHDAPQDLQILSRHTGAMPRNVFDTRRAAGFTGMPSTVSLSHLLQHVLDIHLPKVETRSNWLQRPLSPEQHEYALDDVRYLHALSDALSRCAQDRGNSARLAEEMRIYDGDALYADATPEQLYSRFNTTRWNDKQRALLYTLVGWREIEARQRDKPRGHILQDKDLVSIAQRNPRTGQDLASINTLCRPLTISHRQAIIAAAEAAESFSTEGLPPQPPATRLSAAQKKKVADRQVSIRERAERAGIDPALVATKAEITAVILYEENAGPRPDDRLLNGWRACFTAPLPGPSPFPSQQRLPLEVL